MNSDFEGAVERESLLHRNAEALATAPSRELALAEDEYRHVDAALDGRIASSYAPDLANRCDQEPEADKPKGQLLANISDELYTPLTAVIGYSEMLIEEAASGGYEFIVKDLQRIHSAGYQLLGLINDTLDFSGDLATAGTIETFDIAELDHGIAPSTSECQQPVHDDAFRQRDVVAVAAAPQGGRRHDLVDPIHSIIEHTEVLSEKAERAQLPSLQFVLAGIRYRTNGLLQLIPSTAHPQTTDDIAVRNRIRASVTEITLQIEALASHLEPVLQHMFHDDFGNIIHAARSLLRALDFPDDAAPTVEGNVSIGLGAGAARLLIVDDVELNRDMLSRRLRSSGYHVSTAESGHGALDRLRREPFDLLLVNVVMPEMDGFAVLHAVKTDPLLQSIPIIMISALNEVEAIARCIEMGAEDYLTKPFNPILLKARIDASLEKKRLLDRDLAYRRQIQLYTNHLEDLVQEKVRAVSLTQLSTIFALSRLAESRDHDTGAHLDRLREYCRVLAIQLCEGGRHPQIDRSFIDDLYTASALHDIGKVGIPDSVLQKPGELLPEEYEVMKTHAKLGAETLRAVDREHPGNGFIRIGIEVAECHHEHWDGSGYPDGRAGEEIPLSARILAVADVYDALRSKRCYKSQYKHAQARATIISLSGSRFDPQVVGAFADCEAEFEAISLRLDSP